MRRYTLVGGRLSSDPVSLPREQGLCRALRALGPAETRGTESICPAGGGARFSGFF